MLFAKRLAKEKNCSNEKSSREARILNNVSGEFIRSSSVSIKIELNFELSYFFITEMYAIKERHGRAGAGLGRVTLPIGGTSKRWKERFFMIIGQKREIVSLSSNDGNISSLLEFASFALCC